jgi:uncharacterized protein (UPF0335 family)
MIGAPVFEKGYPDYDAVNRDRMGDMKFTTAGDIMTAQDTYQVTADEIRSFIERFERLQTEKQDIQDAQKEVMVEAKGRGYDTKVLRKVIAIRKRNRDDVDNENAVTQMYMEALGM